MAKDRQQSAGFGLIEVTIVGAVVAILLSPLLKLGLILGKEQSQANTTFHLAEVRNLFYSVLQKPPSWQSTLADLANTSLACLRNHTDCSGRGGELRARDSGNQLLLDYDPLVPTNGFSSNGTTCNTFDAANGSDSCPYRLTLNWVPICPPGGIPCTDPQVKIFGTWNSKPRTTQRTIAFNGVSYGFVLMAPWAGNSFTNISVSRSAPLAIGTAGWSNPYPMGAWFGGTPTQVNFDTVLRDSLDEYNPATGRFTPNQAGLYQMWLFLDTVSNNPWTSGNFCKSMVFVNDVVDTVTATTMPAGPNGCHNFTSVLLQLNARDIVTVIAFITQPGEGRLEVNSPSQTYMRIVRIR